MGTSGSYRGPRGESSLVPSWLDPTGSSPISPIGLPASAPPPNVAIPGGIIPAIAVPTTLSKRSPFQSLTPMGSLTKVRTNFSRFTSSGGSDRASLGRAISGYVSTTARGPRQAARRMGSSRRTGALLLGFLSTAQNAGVAEALRVLDLGALAGQPIENIFLGLAANICPEGGTVDEGIARDAFIETIADLAALGINDIDSLTSEQMHTVFEIYATHAIEARITNDIGTKSLILPADINAVERVQAQLHDFIRGGVSDALARTLATAGALTGERIQGFVDAVYEAAFEILQTLGEAEETI